MSGRYAAIVTGASSGIGRATALALAEGGFTLVLSGRRREALDEVKAECGNLCRSCAAHVLAAEFLHQGDALEFMNEASSLIEPGSYPVLVNCAGAAAFGDFAQMEWGAIEEQLRVNLLLPIALSYMFVPLALERGGGHVVNVLSIAARQVFPGSEAYCASKAGALMFSRCLASDYRAKGLRVTSVIAGATDTPLWDRMDWRPERTDMLPARAVAETIRDAILAPPDRNVDEVVVMPPKGVL